MMINNTAKSSGERAFQTEKDTLVGADGRESHVGIAGLAFFQLLTGTFHSDLT